MDGETLLSLVAPGGASGLGGLCLVVVRTPCDRLLDTLLRATGGIMVAVSVPSLLGRALEEGSVHEVVAGFLVGAAVLAALDAYVPQLHARFAELSHPRASQRATLLPGALTLREIPEGLAVGVAFAAGGNELGLPVAVAIGIQSVPEGFAARGRRRVATGEQGGWRRARGHGRVRRRVRGDDAAGQRAWIAM